MQTRILITKKITIAIIFSMLFAVLPALINFFGSNTQAFLINRAPTSDFFFYEDLQSIKPVYSYEEDLKMASTNITYRPVTYLWNDILRCDYDGFSDGFVNVGSTEDPHFEGKLHAHAPEYGARQSAVISEPKREMRTNVWVWQGAKPKTHATCFIEASICADAGFDTNLKCQTINSNKFRVE